MHGWDDDVSSSVCREKQPWNATTHLLEWAERGRDVDTFIGTVQVIDFGICLHDLLVGLDDGCA